MNAIVLCTWYWLNCVYSTLFTAFREAQEGEETQSELKGGGEGRHGEGKEGEDGGKLEGKGAGSSEEQKCSGERVGQGKGPIKKNGSNFTV